LIEKHSIGYFAAMNTFLLLLLPVCSGDLTSTTTAIDRGETKAGMPLVQPFTLKNSGTAALTITDITGGCGCLRARASQREIPPGETAHIEVEVNTLTQPVGPNTWKAVVRYRQGETTGELELTLKATIVREVSVEPPVLGLTLQNEATHSITIKDPRTKPLTVIGAAVTSPHLTAKIKSRREGVQQVEVTIRETLPAGKHAEVLVLQTDDPDYREFRVPITIDRAGPGQARATPERLDLRLARDQKTASGIVRLRDPEDRPIIVDRIEADHPVLQTKAVSGPGNQATLRLGVELPADGLGGSATVRVFLREPQAQMIVIPVSWRRD